MGQKVEDWPGVRCLIHTPVLVYYRVQNRNRRIKVLHFRHSSRGPASYSL